MTKEHNVIQHNSAIEKALTSESSEPDSEYSESELMNSFDLGIVVTSHYLKPRFQSETKIPE